MWSFAVAEAEVSGVTTVPGDAVGRELLGMIPADARPEDEDAFLEQQVAERRVVLRLKVNRLYGTALDIDGWTRLTQLDTAYGCRGGPSHPYRPLG